jgi:hypothetical protein
VTACLMYAFGFVWDLNGTLLFVWGFVAIRYAIVIAAFVAFVMWVFSVNRNAHTLSRRGMRFTPRRSAIYFFIPYDNLWKPYLVMSEIARTSVATPVEYRNIRALLSRWWFSWTVSLLFGAVVLNFGLAAETRNQWLFALILWGASELFDIWSCLLTIAVMGTIQRLQAAHATARKENAA